MASSRPLSFCLSLRRTVVPTWKVTTWALAGASTVIACWETRGTFLSTMNFPPTPADREAGSRAVPVPVLTRVWSMSSGILRILPAV